MPWVKLDDTFDQHKKVRKAGLEAIGLHARALAHAGREMDGGHVDPEWVEERAGRRGKALVAKLVAVGLWEPNSDGWIIHDFNEYNPTREEWDAERAKRSAAGKRAASARWSRRNA